MANVLLVSENKLKAFTNVNRNVDMDTIRAEISISMDLHLQPLLGTKFYDHLLNQVSATGNTFNADELILVNDYISNYLIQISYFEMIPHLHYRTMNVGLVKAGAVDGGRDGVDIETMKYLRTIQKQRADFYMMRLQDYLITGRGQNKFPQYNSQTTIDGMIANRSEKYNSPIYLNHTSRYGYSLAQTMRNLDVYSDQAHYNPPCTDCGY
jgi:hypothetical protein